MNAIAQKALAPLVCLAALVAAPNASAAPEIRSERKPWGVDYTLVSADGPGDVTLK